MGLNILAVTSITSLIYLTVGLVFLGLSTYWVMRLLVHPNPRLERPYLIQTYFKCACRRNAVGQYLYDCEDPEHDHNGEPHTHDTHI